MEQNRMQKKQKIVIIHNPEIEELAHIYIVDKYPSHSLFAGEDRYTFDSVASIQEAKTKYPDAEVMEALPPLPEMSDSPPEWFDPSYAGEEW